MILDVVEFGMDPQEAVEAPRFQTRTSSRRSTTMP
jgi:gamma-glutamyltranspeptidase